MLETEIHDLSDDPDYAASQLHESVTMTRSDSSKTSSSAEPDGAEVVFLKDNVAIHPTQFASERISGRLKLIKQGGALLMAWIPYRHQNSNARLSEKDRSLYTIKGISLADVRSIRRHTPALGWQGWQYIIVVMSSGLAHPPLYFYSGGVKEFLATIKQHVFLVRSADDANVFLVNDFQNPLQRTLSSLELPMAVSLGNGSPTSIAGSTSHSNENQTIDVGNVSGDASSLSLYNGRPRSKVHDPARDLSIQVLEKFSRVTRFARETTSQLFSEGLNNGIGGHEKRSHIPYPQGYTYEDPHEAEGPLEEVTVAPDPLEFDKLSLVWGKPRQEVLGSDEWATFLDFEGRVVDPKALRKRIFYGGVDRNIRREVWPFLLENFSFDSTYAEREYLKSVKKLEYETIKHQWQSISSEQARRFTKFRERKGLIDKDVVRTDRSISFYEGDDNPNVNLLRDILLTYSFYNFDLGYCQGMSDILSPILYVMGDESKAFWCFVSLMERLGPNFNRDQNGMHAQLFALCKLVELLDNPLHNYFKQNDCLNYFFCFRWILIQFKREFEYHRLMRLWEVLWTHHPSEHLHLYICVAVLKRYRRKIMGEQMDFDTLLKFINELSGCIDLDTILRDAEALCICAGESGAASIPPGTPPSLPVESSLLYPQQDDVL
ncbi:hypothetical protein MLD38_005775 [Melastoma candidum]|uniref:Uncharacterized protein n=1 Tax=Melastoma candidum TaxID=119954 RepID=A0ACB9RKH8_9MYRT|nr:hypothetical protein MLD38_005775 [Melastoma candidum]